MANTIIITKLENGNVDIVDSTAIDKSRTREGGFATRILDSERVIVEDSGSGKGVETFSHIDVEKVIRADGTEVAISDLSTLYSELKEFFFFELSGTGGGGGVVVKTAEPFTIASGSWIPSGSLSAGSTHYFIVNHGLKTKSLLQPSIWETLAGDRFIRQINGFFTTGLDITDELNQVRIEVSAVYDVDGVVSSGGNATIINTLNTDDTITVDTSPLEVGGKLIKVIGTGDIDTTIDAGFLTAGQTVTFVNKTAFEMNFIIGTQDVKASGSNSFTGFGQYSLVSFFHDGTDVILSGDTA